MSYTYSNFATGKLHKTSGKFQGWTDKTGLLNVRYAIFQRPKSSLFIPEYCLTKETRERLDKKDSEGIKLSPEANSVCEKLLN